MPIDVIVFRQIVNSLRDRGHVIVSDMANAWFMRFRSMTDEQAKQAADLVIEREEWANPPTLGDCLLDIENGAHVLKEPKQSDMKEANTIMPCCRFGLIWACNRATNTGFYVFRCSCPLGSNARKSLPVWTNEDEKFLRKMNR